MSAPLWFDNLAAYSVQIALLAIIGTGLAAVLRLRAPQVALTYWQILLAACLTLPMVETWKQTVTVLTNGAGRVGIEIGALALKPGHAAFPIFGLIALALVLGVAFRLARVALGLFRLRRYGHRARAWESVPPAVNELRARLGVAPALLLSNEIGGPVTYGSFRPVVLFPARFAQMDADCQRAIVCHELIHISGGHWFFNLAEEIFLSIFWFHPALAWMVRRIRLAREQWVDREVLQITEARQPYLRALIEIAAGPVMPLTVPAPELMQENQLTQRIALMMKETSMSKLRLVFSFSIALTTLFLTAQVAVRAFPLKARPILLAAPAARVESLANGEQTEESSAPTEKPAEQKAIPTHTSQDVPKLRPIFKVNPIYPPLAKMAKIEGIVELEITVEKNGDVSDLKVESGHPLLAKAALEAVRQWKYAAQAHAVQSTVKVNFTLAKDQSDAEQLAVVKAQLDRVQAEQQVRLLDGQAKVKSVAQLKAEEDALAAQMSASLETSQLQARAQQIALMKAQKAELETRIKEAERELKAAQNNPGENFYPKPIKSAPPIYPPEAKAAHIQGEVVLQVTVDEDGGVSDVEVESGPPALAKAALDAVRQWRFSKPLQAPFTTIMTVNFVLSDSDSKTPASTPPPK
ncbi:MAG TPA: TonB family protein [Terriglobia bacterium]|nr:TonB family protein [Terriglobia bacterium]